MVINFPNTHFAVWNAQSGEFLPCTFPDVTQAREWVIAHLDLSLRNEIVRYGSPRFKELAKVS